MPRSLNAISALILLGILAGTPVSLRAQWFKFRTPGVPRLANGEVNLSAKAPRLANGKPDFSGVWMTAEPGCGAGGPTPVSKLAEILPPSKKCPIRGATMSRQGVNMGIDIPGGLPYQPWLKALVDKRTASLAVDDPHIRCLPDTFLRAYGLPHYLKFVETPNLLVMLNEMNGIYRQVFMDGRPLPNDPNPAWQGYSTATWAGDTLVVNTIGFRDDTWIDWDGSVITEEAKVRERIRRPDFGHLEIEVTVDDPKAYTKPWTVTLRQQFAPDTELIDEICNENEKFSQHAK
ncbi:MAG TPA: hypothetical protein VKY31_06405 [Terriglobia bacterium]|nr:hypothetical protein [Terriglobia bacterium]